MSEPRWHRVEDDIEFGLPTGADLEIKVTARIEGGLGVLSEPDSVEEALEGMEGEAIEVELQGSLGKGNRDLLLRLPKAREGERFVAVAVDDEGTYLTGLPVVASGEAAELPVRLLGSDEDDEEQEEDTVLISPRRVVKLWVKKLLHLPTRELGLFLAEPGSGGSLTYRPAADLGDGARTALIVHGALSEFDAMSDLTHYLMNDDSPRAYDRVLGFDYETVATPIERNGEVLSDALAAAGYPADRSLDVYAYSMGTQVTRSAVELAGGAEKVRRIVLIAPPNGGTRLAADQDRLLKMASMLLSSFAGATGRVLSLLFRAVELGDQGLDDLKPRSGFFDRLGNLGSPWREPYATILGVDDSPSGFLRRLLGKTARAYHAGPNDWVVSSASVREGPVKQPVEIESNHFGFFEDRCTVIGSSLDDWMA